MYRVNERGPELLQIGNDQILRMGSQGGKVMADGGGGSPVNVSNTFVLQQPASRRAFFKTTTSSDSVSWLACANPVHRANIS